MLKNQAVHKPWKCGPCSVYHSGNVAAVTDYLITRLKKLVKGVPSYQYTPQKTSLAKDHQVQEHKFSIRQGQGLFLCLCVCIESLGHKCGITNRVKIECFHYQHYAQKLQSAQTVRNVPSLFNSRLLTQNAEYFICQHGQGIVFLESIMQSDISRFPSLKWNSDYIYNTYNS